MAVEGWFGYGGPLLALLQQHRPVHCVEVGTWLGASAIPIAKTIEAWNGTLVCVDPWTGDPGWEHSYPDAWAKAGDEAYGIFLKNIQAAGCSNITPDRRTSVEAARSYAPGSMDFLWLDGLHDEQSVRTDIAVWWPVLKPGALLAGDDYGSWPGVTAAWNDVPNKQTQHGENEVGLVWAVK